MGISLATYSFGVGAKAGALLGSSRLLVTAFAIGLPVHVETFIASSISDTVFLLSMVTDLFEVLDLVTVLVSVRLFLTGISLVEVVTPYGLFVNSVGLISSFTGSDESEIAGSLEAKKGLVVPVEKP